MPSKPAVQATAVQPTGAPTLFIDGGWVAARDGRTFEAENPATGRVIGVLAAGGRSDAAVAIDAAARAASAWGPP